MPMSREAEWSYVAASGGISNTNTAVTIKGAAGVAAGTVGEGARNCISNIQLMWESLTNATEVAIRDGAGGTVLWRTKIPSGAAGRESVVFDTALVGSAATLLEVLTITASGAGAVYFNAQGFVGR